VTDDYVFDSRLERASTLPARCYFQPEFLLCEQRQVFSNTWQLVGRSEKVSRPGEYFTCSVAGEPIIVVRGADDKLRALSNVCRHRAGPVASGEGARRAFQCGYHGWTYDLNGHLIATREFEGVEGFSPAENCLPEFRAEVWNSLVFVNLDRNSVSLEIYLDDLPQRLEHRELGRMRFAARKDWEINCNWKVYVDNYLEGYHIPVVHPSLNREIDYSRYRTETRRNYSIQHSPIRADRAERLRIDDNSDSNEAQFFWIFPNLMLNVYPDNYSTNLIVPLGPERTLTIFEWYFLEPEREEVQENLRATISFSDEIQLEDIAICEAVQRGLHSATYVNGRYCVKRENGVHHFHGLLAERLKDHCGPDVLSVGGERDSQTRPR
jgi:choline monooxygenase